jgi:general secretion pathway protein J
MQSPSQRSLRRVNGFTLIELLVAVTILAVLAVLAWRSIDGMVRASGGTRAHSDAVLSIEAGLGQWGADLDALQELPSLTALDWDGRALRITRRHSADPGAGAVVVAWSRRVVNGRSSWLRWQSAPVSDRQSWQNAWLAAAQWAQTPTLEASQLEVNVAPLEQWQIYYFRGGAWTNPLSSAGTVGPTAAPASATSAPLPDGVRLVLTLPDSHPMAGTLQRDWARPGLTPSAQ